MRKILYSPGFGAGWYTWNSGEVGKYMLTYQPIIDFLEAGGKFTREDSSKYSSENPVHPLLKQLCDECQAKFGHSPYVGGADDLKVAEVGDGPVALSEYDGYESLGSDDYMV